MEHHNPVIRGRSGAVWQGAGWSHPDVGEGGGGGGHRQDFPHTLRPSKVRLFCFLLGFPGLFFGPFPIKKSLIFSQFKIFVLIKCQ